MDIVIYFILYFFDSKINVCRLIYIDMYNNFGVLIVFIFD